MPAKAIKHILHNAPELRSLTGQSRRLLHLQQLVRSKLPASIASEVAVGGLVSGTLTLITASGPVAAKLRHLKPRLVKQLRQDERELNALKIVVQVPANYNSLPKKQNFLGHTAKNALLTLSSRVESPALRSALLRLASRTAPSNRKQETLEEVDPYKNQGDGESDS